MRIFSSLIFLTLLFLSSCFSSRKSVQSEPILIVDPVELTFDTISGIKLHTESYGKHLPVVACDLSADSLKEVIDSLEFRIDSLELMVDSLQSLVLDLEDGVLVDEIAVSTVTIIGTGDIMPGTNYPTSSYLPPGNDAARLLAPVKDVLENADVTFGNLEGVIGEGGTAKNCSNPKTCYVFRMPEHYIYDIMDAGYDVLSVANNHVNDFGYGGRVASAKVLNDAGIPYAGYANKPSVIFEKNEITYGFAAFAPHSGTANLKDYQKAADIVSKLDSICDIVIVSFHGGAEGRDHQNTPCSDEIYLGYNRGNICKFSHAVVDAGADIVFGHGPHVTRAMELYKDRLICYSLGNFCTYRRFNLSGPNGIAPIVKAELNPDGSFHGGEVISVYQPGEGGPRPDAQKRVVFKLQELMKNDFPESPLQIDDNGQFFIQEPED